MVQVIGPGTPRGPNIWDKLAGGIGGLTEAYSGYQQQKQSREVMKQLGLPENIPPELAKQVIAERMKGQMTPLQQSQKKLADERLTALKGQQDLFRSLQGGQPEAMQEEGVSGQQSPQGLSGAPIDKLHQVAAFAGQPGEAGIVGNMAKTEIEKREKQEKISREDFQNERGYHSSYSKKAEETANQMRQSLPKKEMALDMARQAIETQDMGFFSPDKLADATGIDLFRTAKGAQLVTAGKENLLSNLSRVSSKGQNLWFEQRLNSMFPKIGQSKEANLTVQEMIEAENQIDKAYLDAFDRLSQEDESKYKFVRKDIEKRARDAVKPIEKDVLKRTTYRMKEIEEREKGLISMRDKVGKNVVKGTPLTMEMAKLYIRKFGKENALNVAEKNGYYVPTYEDFQIFNARPEEFRETIVQ